MADSAPSRQSWWQTLPGILTGVAALITAVTGLIVAFNHSSTRGESEATSVHGNSSAAQPSSSTVTDSHQATTASGMQKVALPSITTVKLAGGDAILTLISAEIEPLDLQRRALKFHLRYMNGGRFPANFWTDSFQLLVDDVPRAPTNFLDEVVAAQSAKEGDIVFELPMAVKEVVLQISAGDDKSRLPFKLP